MTHHDASCISCIQHSSFSTILAMMTWSPPYVWSGTRTPGWLEVEPGFGRGWGHDIHEICSERCLDDIWRWLEVLYKAIYRPFKIPESMLNYGFVQVVCSMLSSQKLDEQWVKTCRNPWALGATDLLTILFSNAGYEPISLDMLRYITICWLIGAWVRSGWRTSD